MRILSLGAGVQSTTIALMAQHGDIPPIDCAIFADTQSEPLSVYRHLEWLRSQLSYPVHVVSKGSLRDEIVNAALGRGKAWGRLPFFLINKDGFSRGMTRRQCTGDYKIDPIMRKVREIAGIKRGSPGPRRVVVEQLIGISIDEAHRMRDARFRWVSHVYPLVDLRMTRQACLLWMKMRGFPTPPKSACTFCPFHSDAMWRDMKDNDPVSFNDAVAIDEVVRGGTTSLMLQGTPYLHRQRIPLRDVDFTDPRSLNGDLFGEECEGVCGV